MSICTGCSFFPPAGFALCLAVYPVSQPRISFHTYLAAAGDHLPPVYDFDVCVGLQSAGRRDRLGVVLGDPGLLA